MVIKLKVPEMDLLAALPDKEISDAKLEHWHEWSCGCKTSLTRAGFDILACKEDCDFFLVFTGKKEPDLRCQLLDSTSPSS